MTDCCFSCGAAEAEFACSRCRQVRFCNAACQRSGWPSHKPACRPIGAALPTTPGQRTPGLAGALLRAVAGAPSQVTVYPNVGRLQGEVEVLLTPSTPGLEGARGCIARALFGADEEEASRIRLFSLDRDGAEISSLEGLLQQQAASGGVIASLGFPLRCRTADRGPTQAAAAGARDEGPGSSGRRRYDASLVGSGVTRLRATDPELPSLLRCAVPVVVEGSGLVGEASTSWSFDYLDRHLSDVDNFFVLHAPAESEGRFAYYDLGGKKNPCNYALKPTNVRKEMRFPDFRREASRIRRERLAGRPCQSLYLQNALLHRPEGEDCPPRPVGGFGVSCGVRIAGDINSFRWPWLKEVMGGRNVQMCQLFCGIEGDFSPCHYDPQDNVFAQVRGYKRVLLFHPRHFGRLYPWPVHHPQDRQSRVDFDCPDAARFPRFGELCGEGLEAVLGPGDAIRIPPGWWHHIEMLPSPPDGEVVSINFWYPPPQWFRGDPANGEIFWDKPLYGVRRVLFQRCVEELIAQNSDPAQVQAVLRACLGELPPPQAGSKAHDAAQSVLTFTSTVFPEEAQRRRLLREMVEGRFDGLVPGVG